VGSVVQIYSGPLEFPVSSSQFSAGTAGDWQLVAGN
jgi:hypothetical protein